MAKAGFVTIIGRPNVGKSTLMNTLIGQKIAITSYKPQTTRNQIRTIYTDKRGQIVFLDTPGMHASKDKLGQYMTKAAESAIRDVDVALWLVEPKLAKKDRDEDTSSPRIGDADLAVMKALATGRAQVILCVTKIDTVKKDTILPVMEAYRDAWQQLTGHELRDIIPVSARHRIGTDDLLSTIYAALPEGEPFYDAEEVTTQSQREIAQEIIREKALRLLQEEVPHGIAVKVNTFKYRETTKGEPIYDIHADIICEREAHKGIVIGKGGAMLSKIGSQARIDIENMTQTKVNLKLFVKVRKDWKDNDAALAAYGYNVKDLKQKS